MIMNLRSCSLSNPSDDMVDSEIIEEKVLHISPLPPQMSKKKTPNQV